MKRQIEGFIFDLDGTVYLGESALPGAVVGIKKLLERNKRVIYVSNKPLYSPQNYAEKLTRLGISTQPDDVITSAYVLAHHLAKEAPHLRYYIIGEKYLKQEFSNHHLKMVNELQDQAAQEVMSAQGIDAVVVAFDRTLNYAKLNLAYQALSQGARFFATNSDKVCPLPNGAIPDAGATIAALEHISGRKVELIAGKPSALITQVTLDYLGLLPEQVMMVGDRLETDILMGQQAGMVTAVTLTGVAKREDVEQMEKPPDFIIETLEELSALVC